MERKRRMPARAAARCEHVAKKNRTSTPPNPRSATSSTAPNGTPTPASASAPDSAAHRVAHDSQNQPPALSQSPPLPTSVQHGKPLPTVDGAQPQHLPNTHYQSVHESGVVAESLSRSRNRWISDGLFEKYWTRPAKKKGVAVEDVKNPPKETMSKIGQVTISLEPHYFEATVYAVKDPNKPTSQPAPRPILQYGPANGAMPPPPTPITATAATTPAPPPAPPALPSRESSAVPPGPPVPTAPAAPSAIAPASQPVMHPQTPTPRIAPAPPTTSSSTQAAALPSAPSPAPVPAPASAPAAPTPPKAVASPRAAVGTVLSRSTASPAPAAARPPNNLQPLAPQTSQPPPPPSPLANSAAVPGSSAPHPCPAQPPALVASGPAPSPGASRAAPTPMPPKPAPVPAGADPIIVTLAEKANEDPQLRDLMKRVANGNAPKEELARFQAIIDQITAESKRKGSMQGPSADRLFVDGRSVRYFADEVDAIVSIVLRSNPKQTSADLTPPSGSDPLVVALVRAAMDDPKILDRARRIVKNTPEFSDSTDLKELLERLKGQVTKQKPQPPPPAGAAKANGAPATQPQAGAAQPPPATAAPQQALRSKGPPPLPKPDVAAVVLEFAGGNGNRYLFPRFSIVEHVQTAAGPRLIASFLIVRKGSFSDYGGDPKLDYYQPVTVRISSTQPRTLDYFSKVVAPPAEVRRYMDDVMDNMTRAEYVLLAMRLPKPEKEVKEEGQGLEKEAKADESNHATPEVEDAAVWRKGLTWKKDKTIKQLTAKSSSLKNGAKKSVSEDGQYQHFIASVSRKEAEDEG